MRTRLKRCTDAVTACCGRCSTLEQLSSALNLINPWTCSRTGGCTPVLASAAAYMPYSGSSSSDAGSGARPNVKHNNRRQTQGQHNGKQNSDGARTLLQHKKPPDDPGDSTALAGLLQDRPSNKAHGFRSRAALNAAVAAAAAADSAATVAVLAAVHGGAVQPSSAGGSKAATQKGPTAWKRSAGAGSQQQQQEGPSVPADNSTDNTGHMLSIIGVNSAGSSSVTSSAGSLDVPGDDACFTSHPLPSYALNDEEQDSYAKAKDVVAKLQSLGYKALIVGGWVRDKYLGRRASDIDISTNATPWELKKLFRHVVELPRSTVKVTHQGEVLEVTCFRGISRAASMFSVAMDAARRDFTLNALYYDPITDQVLDCVGGVEDAKQRVLRLTGDSVARLEEDPLRVLRCVRFVTVLGLRMAPATAKAVKQHAHLCSIQHGLPPRRIWLELCKLRRAEQQQAGSWAVALKLCYHLGLLQHIFPWLQQDHKQQPDSTPAHANAVQQQAVLVAERLGQLWQGRNVPLGLMVAATLHPAASNNEQACQQLESYFSNLPDDLAAVRIFLKGAQLTHSSSAPSSEDDAWAQVYASQHSAICLDILAAWIPDAVAGSFQQLHQERMLQLRGRIAHHRRLLQLKRDQQACGQQQLPKPLPAAASSEALQQRRIRQKEELTAAIQALMGEQEQQAEQERQVVM